MAEDTPTPSPTPIPTAWSRARACVRGLSFSRFQSVVATLTGLVSVLGAAFSVVQFVRPGNTGELVATVYAADSHRSVTDATVEVLTPENALVATLTPDSE